ncbi:MAG: hypothetical protein ACO38D_07700, partial [Ilumatobacteraceae bacterium]
MSDTNASRPGFDPSNPAFRADPYPFYDELRQHDPVHRTPFDTIVLTRYEDVAWTLRSNDFSRDVEANGNEPTDELGMAKRTRRRSRTGSK